MIRKLVTFTITIYVNWENLLNYSQITNSPQMLIHTLLISTIVTTCKTEKVQTYCKDCSTALFDIWLG